MAARRRIVVNVTASAGWRRRPVGIIRVERELVRQLLRLRGDDVCPVVLDMESRKFKALSRADLGRVLSEDWVAGSGEDEAGSIDARRLPLFRAGSADHVVSVGSDWSFDVPQRVAELYGDRRVLTTACYDMIPLLFPEYTPDADFGEQFVRHYSAVARQAKAVFAISRNSGNDLQRFWTSWGVDREAPPVHVVPLAGLDRPQRTVSLEGGEQAAVQALRDAGDYVLFVSTLEPRKNHQLLLDLWREFHAERGPACPQLVFVGMRGWGSGDLIDQMQRMPAARAGRIRWLQGVSDAMLAALYQHCLLAVFPSLYEGWGLAATEAMTHGKACVVADSSSLGEASHGLVPALHPHDFLGWKAELTRLFDEPGRRDAIEQRVRTGMPARRWDDFGEQFVRELLAD